MKQTPPRVKQVDLAPPFDGSWNFVVVQQAFETPQQDYYVCNANHDQNPGSGDGMGYMNGRNQGFFRAGLGDVPLPPGGPVGWWAYQHNFQIGPFTKTFQATFEVLGINFNNEHGYDKGGTAQVWASIMQCQIDPNKDLNEYNVLDAAIRPVHLGYTGTFDLTYDARLSADLNITNPSEEYAFRIGWIVQIHYKDSQKATLEMQSYWHNFNGARLVEESTQVEDIEGPEKAKMGSSPMSFEKLPKGFVIDGRIVGV